MGYMYPHLTHIPKNYAKKIFLWWHERKITDTVNSLGYYLCMAGGIGKEETRRELFMGQKAVGKVRCEFDYGQIK